MSIDLKELERLTNDPETYHKLAKHLPFIRMDRDRNLFMSTFEHYALLLAVSEMLGPMPLIYDIGTYKGLSALALSQKGFVISYDINYNVQIERPNNIEFRIGDFYHDDSILKSSLIFFDIDPHDGIQESKFHNSLIHSSFNGYVIFDDIHLNDDMKKFWNSIELPKYDLTDIGHWSGTGLVDFSHR